MNKLFLLCFLYIDVICSEPYARDVTVVNVPHLASLELPEQISSRSSGTTFAQTDMSEEEQLYDIAVKSFYPKSIRKQPALVAFHAKQLIKNQSGFTETLDESSPVTTLRKKRDTNEVIEGIAQARVEALLLEAAHEALDDMEQKLDEREQVLLHREAQLARKMSKRKSALITTLTASATTIISGFLVFLIK